MTNIKLSERDKEDLLEFLNDYSLKVSPADIKEIDNKLSKKISFLKKKKNMPSFTKKMIRQLRDLQDIWESQNIPKEERARITAGLHYFIWAEDKIPDYIPVLGYLDDAFIIDIIHRAVTKSLQKENDE